MKSAPLVFRNFFWNRRRTILTALAIGLAIFAYTALSSLPFVMSQAVRTPQSARRVVSINRAGFLFSLPEYATTMSPTRAVERIESEDLARGR